MLVSLPESSGEEKKSQKLIGNLTEIFGYELDIRASLAQIRAKLTMYQQTQLSYHVE